jgi:hypothetical protein
MGVSLFLSIENRQAPEIHQAWSLVWVPCMGAECNVHSVVGVVELGAALFQFVSANG